MTSGRQTWPPPTSAAASCTSGTAAPTIWPPGCCPAWKRRHVHALYGFTRYADEIVDRTDAPAARRARGPRWTNGPGGSSPGCQGEAVDDPLLPAVLHTIAVFDLDRADFASFLRSMAMDLTVTSYPTYDDLLDYMEGSAAVIGTMMLPILGSDDPAAAREPARQLGLAFQLTNFIRDVAEDLDRGRTYLPDDDLARFGVTRDDLAARASAGRSTPEVKDLIGYEVTARPGATTPPRRPGSPCWRPPPRPASAPRTRSTAASSTRWSPPDYDVFVRRATVPNRRRAAVAARALLSRAGTPVALPGSPVSVPA